jgi:hypothetical protein
MEVHHHPDVGKKTLKEYLLEGLMIFIAVTMGFFAESIRESINQHNREKEYISSFAEDLRIDTSRINRTVWINVYNLKRLDTLETLLLEKHFTPANILHAYKLLDRTEDAAVVIFDERTYSQLRGSGQAGIFRSTKVANAIEDYEFGVKDCQELFEYYDRQMWILAESSKKIFSPEYRFDASRRYLHASDSATHVDPALAGVMDSIASRGPLILESNDPVVIDNFASDVGFYERIVFSYIRDIEGQKKSAVALLALMQDEYDLSVPTAGQ